MLDSCTSIFGSKKKLSHQSSLENGDNPELDTTNFLDANGIQQLQSLIDTLQWVVSLDRIGITTSVINISSFRVEHIIGHADRIKKIYS